MQQIASNSVEETKKEIPRWYRAKRVPDSLLCFNQGRLKSTNFLHRLFSSPSLSLDWYSGDAIGLLEGSVDAAVVLGGVLLDRLDELLVVAGLLLSAVDDVPGLLNAGAGSSSGGSSARGSGRSAWGVEDLVGLIHLLVVLLEGLPGLGGVGGALLLSGNSNAVGARGLCGGSSRVGLRAGVVEGVVGGGDTLVVGLSVSGDGGHEGRHFDCLVLKGGLVWRKMDSGGW